MLLMAAIVLQGPLYRSFVSYESVGQRKSYSITNEALLTLINDRVDFEEDMRVNDIVNLAFSITCTQLNFTTGKNNVDPNKLVTSKTANCIGYATFYSSVCNHLLERFHLNDQWRAKAQIGHLSFLGHDVHQLFGSPFFKDHDFVTIESFTNSDSTIVVDPSLRDYFYINSVTYSGP